MKLLDRYISKVVITSILMVVFVVVGLDGIFALIDELQNLENNYQSQEALQYVVATLPKRFYEFISLSVLIGCLLGLGSLANHSELTVMRAAGMSVMRISYAVIKPALVFVCIGVLVGEYVVPYTEAYAQSQRALEQSGNEALKSKHGYWHREGNTYMYFNAVLPGGVLYGVTQYQFDDQRQLRQSSFARKAIYQGDHWVLQNITLTNLFADHAQKQELATKRWDTELTPEVLKVVVVKPEDLSIRGLHTYSRYLLEQGLTAKKYMLAYWKKILQPLASVVMVLVALSCIFGPLRSVTMGFRIFSGVILGLLFKYTEDFLGPASIVFGFAPIFASLIPIILFFVLALVLLKRVG